MARTKNWESGLARMLERRWRCYRKALRRCQRNFSEGSIHASRIEARRMAAQLELLPSLSRLPTARKALARLGYSQVRASYAAHKQEGLEVFAAIGDRRLRPPMDFVRDWLREERTRIIDQVRWLFYVAMLATILAGATFVATVALLG